MSTMDLVVLMLRHTPWWVFPLVAVVLFFGVINLRPRAISAPRLAAFPLVMLGLSLSNAIGTSAAPGSAMADWLACAALGTAIGWAMTAPPLGIEPGSCRPRIAGSAVPLIVTVAIVVLHYAFGYAYGRHPELRADPTLALELIAASALLTGITFGRYGRLGWWWWWRRHQAKASPA